MTDNKNKLHKANERERKTSLGLVRCEVWLPAANVKEVKENASETVRALQISTLTVKT